MKYVKECTIIFGITLVGELLNAFLPLPVPAGVYGLFLLLLLLCGGIVKLEDVEATGNFLLDTMPIMFIPACVGLIESYGSMKQLLIPLLVICMASTVIVMGVTGKVAEAVLSVKKNRDGVVEGEPDPALAEAMEEIREQEEQ
ncbi:MAG: CidA/LrgA family protein [Eubacteriales bacterium]|nr:CidA/LrgA family protein [Eubacteriales bacterium]